ncbi:MAG: HNH endonuclease [Leptospirales bacterium]
MKKKLLTICQNVATAAADYDTKAKSSQLYRKKPQNKVGTVSGDEIVKVYTLRMVPKTSNGRLIYDRIMSAPVNGRCPLCGIGTVNTLDHYLPKKHFPVFSVTPNNLIPACQWCQREKSEYYPATEGDQLLHPYFDKVDNDVWLKADVVVCAPAGFRYFASPPSQWTQSTKDRVVAHLEKLKLRELFSSNAGSRLSEIRARLACLHQKGGVDAVRTYLHEELASIETDHKNSWAAAMYRAAVACDWFCNGGFL